MITIAPKGAKDKAMKPTKRQITYLQSFGKAFKPVEMNPLCKALWSERDSIKRLSVMIAPIDCGIDMITINQQIRDAIKNRLIIITDESKKGFTNFESMENPELVEC